MNSAFRPLLASLSVTVLFASACPAPPFAALCPIPENGSAAERQAAACACQGGAALEQQAWNRIYQKVDFLFVVSNTAGMAAKQQALVAAYAPILAYLTASDFDYHIGVVSSDVGTWTAPDTPFATSTGACDSFAGDDGRLQTRSCRDRPGLSPEARAACAAVCPDSRFLPTDGRPYLSRERGRTNVPQALELDPKTGLLIDRGPEYALGCMLVLGDAGCAVSAPLESARRALDGHIPENDDLLRLDARANLVFLTDRDDCSVQASRRGENDPQPDDCPRPDLAAPATCYSLGAYRCLAGDLRCNEPLNAPGLKTGCQQRPDTYLEPIDSYVRFFASLPQNPQLSIFGNWPLPELGETGEILVTSDPRIPGSAGLRASPGLVSGCRAPDLSEIEGTPQRRLTRLLRSFYAGLDARYPPTPISGRSVSANPTSMLPVSMRPSIWAVTMPSACPACRSGMPEASRAARSAMSRGATRTRRPTG